jgi:hypothetical protein
MGFLSAKLSTVVNGMSVIAGSKISAAIGQPKEVMNLGARVYLRDTLTIKSGGDSPVPK